jgi:hypothetical protein
MNDKFDELAKNLAQAVTRRQALRRFGVGVGAFLLATVGATRSANASKDHGNDLKSGYCLVDSTGTLSGTCYACNANAVGVSPDCSAGATASVNKTCGGFSLSSTRCKYTTFP